MHSKDFEEKDSYIKFEHYINPDNIGFSIPITPSKLVKTLPTDIDIDSLLEEFTAFLKGAGYPIANDEELMLVKEHERIVSNESEDD